jgi:hypothetical protein
MELAILIIQCVILFALGAFIWVCVKVVGIFGELNASLGAMFGKPGIKK